jgi:hypothetical protein
MVPLDPRQLPTPMPTNVKTCTCWNGVEGSLITFMVKLP